MTARLASRTASSRLRAQAKLRLVRHLRDEGILDLMIRLGPHGAGILGGRWSGVGSRIPGGDALKAWFRRALGRMVVRRPALSRVLPYTAYGSGRSGPVLDLKTLRSRPHGVDLGPLQPGVRARVFHPDRAVRLAPDLFLGDLERLRAKLHGPPTHDGRLLLIGRRHLLSNNSWMHNIPRLMRGDSRCKLLISEADAARLSLQEGQHVRLRGRHAEIRLPVTVSAAIMPGVVCMPHGWGHGRPGVQLAVATNQPGVSMNDVTDELQVDELTGMAVLNGVPVEVIACQSEHDGPSRASEDADAGRAMARTVV